MRKVDDLVITIGRWTDRHGIRRPRRIRYGVLLRDDVTGREEILIEMLPASEDLQAWYAAWVMGR